MAQHSTSSTFVGRQRELDDLSTHLDEGVAGRGRLVLLAGDAGMGKTRLLEELVGARPTPGHGMSLGQRPRGRRCSAASDWTAGVEHADWPVRLVGTRYFVITQSYAIVDRLQVPSHPFDARVRPSLPPDWRSSWPGKSSSTCR